MIEFQISLTSNFKAIGLIIRTVEGQLSLPEHFFATKNIIFFLFQSQKTLALQANSQSGGFACLATGFPSALNSRSPWDSQVGFLRVLV